MGKYKDLTGMQFGMWYVLSRAENAGTITRWNCICQCGAQRVVRSQSLLNGKSTSCGCLKKENASKSRTIDLLGQRFGMLEVVERAQSNAEGKALWRCKCDCGNYTTVSGRSLRSGKTKSCGCRQRYTHGGTHTRLHNIWLSMRFRCNTASCASYKYYGGRGILVCNDWNESFEAFSEWSLANGYQDTLTLDRINVDGDYCPENCRWVTRKIQSNNTRQNRKVEWREEVHTISEWIDILDLPASTTYRRIARGWSAERAFTEPIHNKDRGGYNGEEREM